jgi:hypothetical protein
MLQLEVVRKPATKAKKDISPFIKETMTIKAKPARNVVMKAVFVRPATACRIHATNLPAPASEETDKHEASTRERSLERNRAT